MFLFMDVDVSRVRADPSVVTPCSPCQCRRLSKLDTEIRVNFKTKSCFSMLGSGSSRQVQHTEQGPAAVGRG